MIFEAVELFEGCDASVAASCIMLISSWTTLIWHRSLFQVKFKNHSRVIQIYILLWCGFSKESDEVQLWKVPKN